MTEIKATLTLSTGGVKETSQNCLDSNGQFNLTGLHRSSVLLQKELNSTLTTLVEDEKAQNSNSGAYTFYYISKVNN